MRKFTYKDTTPWVVVNVEGKIITFRVNTEEGVKTVTSFDGFRSANNMARQGNYVAKRK